jgi:hypothetical protein
MAFVEQPNVSRAVELSREEFACAKCFCQILDEVAAGFLSKSLVLPDLEAQKYASSSLLSEETQARR